MTQFILNFVMVLILGFAGWIIASFLIPLKEDDMPVALKNFLDHEE